LHTLPVTAYAFAQEKKHGESIQQWILKPGRSRCCRKCLHGEQRAEAGDVVQTYACKVCKKRKAMKFFTKKDVLSLVALDKATELVCFDCMDVGIIATKDFYCSACKIQKPFDAFPAVQRKWIQHDNPRAQKVNRYKCSECACPPCVACGAIAEEPVNSGGQAYYCDPCSLTKNPSGAVSVKLIRLLSYIQRRCRRR